MTATFSAVNSSGAAQSGSEKEDGAVIGQTSRPFSHMFRSTRRQPGGEWEVVYRAITLSVLGFGPADVDRGGAQPEDDSRRDRRDGRPVDRGNLFDP